MSDDRYRLARAAHAAGQWAEAEVRYRELLDREPAHVGALVGLAELALRFHQPAVAVPLLEQACAAGPPTPDLLALLTAARDELSLVQDVDYAEQRDSPWRAADSVWEEKAGHDVLIVTFAGLGVGRSPPTFIFRKFLAAYAGVDKLFLRDVSLRWYLHGLPGLTTDVPSTIEYLERATRGYRRRVFLGCSAGATAAVLYGERLGADRVLAFAPQTVLGAAKVDALGDPRWEHRLARLRASPDVGPWLDLAAHGPLSVPVEVYYPADSHLDRAHALRLTGPAVTHCAQPGRSHLVALEMRDRGELAGVVNRAISPAAGENR